MLLLCAQSFDGSCLARNSTFESLDSLSRRSAQVAASFFTWSVPSRRRHDQVFCAAVHVFFGISNPFKKSQNLFKVDRVKSWSPRVTVCGAVEFGFGMCWNKGSGGGD